MMIKRLLVVGTLLLVAGFVAYTFDLHRRARFYLSPRKPLPHASVVDPILVGNYYFGDGLGVNQRLQLENDGTFQCNWSGCIGDYGSTSGSWARREDTLYVSTKSADGMFLGKPLEDMTILVHNGKPHFLKDGYRSFIENFGENSIPDATFSSTEE